MSYTRAVPSQPTCKPAYALRYCRAMRVPSGCSTCSPTRRSPATSSAWCPSLPTGLDDRHDAHAGARDRVLRDDVRDRGAGRRLRRAHLHARRRAAVRRASRRSARRSCWLRPAGSARRSCRPRRRATCRSRSTSGATAPRCGSCRRCSVRRSTDRAAVALAAGPARPTTWSTDLPVVAASTGLAASDGAAARRGHPPPGRARTIGAAPRSARRPRRIALPVRGARRRRRDGPHVRPGRHRSARTRRRGRRRVRSAPTCRRTDSRACRAR